MPAETAYAPSEPEDWFVFETFGADGTLAIGVAQGTPDPSAVIVVRDGLTRKAARELAARLAAEYQEAGRLPDSAG
jgi:hypothetical protein